jgi:hypothetical protein
MNIQENSENSKKKIFRKKKRKFKKIQENSRKFKEKKSLEKK